jgi:endonuclease III
MRKSREYAQRLLRFYRGLKREHAKIEPVIHDDPVDALIYGVVSERMSASAAEAAMKTIHRTFINWNDLRVSRPEEIVEVLGNNTAAGRDTAIVLTTALRAVFDAQHTVSLQALKKLGKRPARQAIEKLGISRFSADYCMLTSLHAHAVPLTEPMLGYLRQHKLVDPQADVGEIQGFLTRQVPAKNAYEFYALLREECERCKAAGKRPSGTVRRKTTRRTAKTARARK